MNKTILFVGAHNDDAEIFCWWSLLHHKSLWYNIHLAIRDHKDESRKKEQTLADKLSGFQSSYFWPNNELHSILMSQSPHIVITHWDKDRHPDHREIYQMVLKNMKDLKIQQWLPQRFYVCSTYDNLWIDDEFSPTDYIDISNYQEQKNHLINQFTSQDPKYWVKKANIISQLYWSRIKTDYAEALKEIFYLGKIEPRDDLFK